MDTLEFQAISPRKKIPVFEDGDLTLFESAAIINYLARTYGEGDRQLIPSDPADRAHCDEWCYFVAMELDATSLYVIRRHGDLPEIYGEAPAAVECAAEYFARQIMVPEQKLSDKREFILGSAFSIADVMLTSCVTWAIRYGQRVPDRLISYRKSVVARPAYQAAFAVCYPDL
jgi:glutathione S-transferase